MINHKGIYKFYKVDNSQIKREMNRLNNSNELKTKLMYDNQWLLRKPKHYLLAVMEHVVK